jgi:hypothetical protein
LAVSSYVYAQEKAAEKPAETPIPKVEVTGVPPVQQAQAKPDVDDPFGNGDKKADDKKADEKKADEKPVDPKVIEKAKKLVVSFTELKLGPEFISEPLAEYLVALPVPTSNYADFGIRTRINADSLVVPTVLQWKLGGKDGKAFVSSCGHCALLKTLGGSDLVLVPENGTGLGVKINAATCVFLPYRDGKYGKAIVIDPVPSAMYPGYEVFATDGPGLALMRAK